MKHPGTVLSPAHISKISTNTAGIAKLHKDTSIWESKLASEKASRCIACVDIGPNGMGVGHAEFTEDAMQCYRYVLLFLAESNVVFAERAASLLIDWCTKCTVFKGSNAPLECAWGGTCFVRSAELIKYKWSGWSTTHAQAVNIFIDNILIPNLTTRYKEISLWYNNWILTILECLQQIYIYKNDDTRFNWVMEQYKQIAPKTFVGATGKNTESDRDTIHETFQMSSHVQFCEVAYNQGYNIYNDAIMKSCEYIASKLNGKVPPDMTTGLRDNWCMPGAWEIAYNHYVRRSNRVMPETDKMMRVKGRRPEGMSFNWGPGWVYE